MCCNFLAGVLALFLTKEMTNLKAKDFLREVMGMLEIKEAITKHKPCTCGAGKRNVPICKGCKCRVRGVECTPACGCYGKDLCVNC
jgi:hypothetical protein